MNKNRESIFVFGASGHAKVVIDVIEKQGLFDIAFLVDDDLSLKHANVYGYHVIGGKHELISGTIRKGIVAIGSNSARRTVASWLTENGFDFVSAVHPSAQLARGVKIGNGSVVMAGVAVNSDTMIGNNVILNTRASIDHDCTISDSVHIAPGSVLCGSVTVGEGSFICAGATVIPNLSIGKNVIVGAGSTVIRNVSDNITVVGSPAKQVI